MCLCAQSCPILCDPVECSPPGSLSMGFSKQEYWSVIPFSRGSFWPKDRTHVSCIAQSSPSEPVGKQTPRAPTSDRWLRITGATQGGGQFIKLSQNLSNSGIVLLGRSVRRPREQPLKPGPTVFPSSRQPASQPITTAGTWPGVTTRERRRHASPLRLREPPLPQGPREPAGHGRAGRGLEALRACAKDTTGGV